MTTYFGLLSAAPQGNASFFQKLTRYSVLAVSAVVGAFVLILTASAALVVVLALLFIGLIVFAYLWTRARFFGKSIGGKAFDDMKAAAQAHQARTGTSGLHTSAADYDADDVVEAHKTPDGWTVD